MTNVLNRREFLKVSGIAASLAALAACRPLVQEDSSLPTLGNQASTPTLQFYDDEWLLRRTLHRITIAPRFEDIEYAREIGIDNYIDEQLDPGSINDSEIDSMLSQFTTLNSHPRELFNIEPRSLPTTELITATIFRVVYSKRQLYELIVEFWTNHFNIYIASAPEVFFKPTDDREVIRPHALGSFSDLLHASAKSPAMLTYLDNAESTKDRPNENYARELLELHTMGVDGGFTQLDVEEVARAFTGWTVGGPRTDRVRAHRGEFVFLPSHHDEDEKLVLGRNLPAGREW